MRFSRLFLSALSLVFLVRGSLAQSSVPTIARQLPAQTLTVSAAATSIDLRTYFSVPTVTGTVVQFDTVLGKFNVEMLAGDAPLSVANFLNYVSSGAYANTFFHRSTALGAANTNRILQGGGYGISPSLGASINRLPPIPLEYKLANARGTLAMARTSELNSATSEWYFNVDDNTTVLGASNGGGYAVFARVIGTGMSVVDALAAVPIFNAGGAFTTIPLRNVTSGQSNILASNLLMVNSISTIPIYPTGTGAAVLSFALSNSASSVASASVAGSTLNLTGLSPGTATIIVRATDVNGNLVDNTFAVTVASGLTITTQPRGQIVPVGGAATFTVAAEGSGNLTYQWRKDGVALAGATGASLTISSVQAANAGNYDVIVTGAAGSVTSAVAILNVGPTNRINNVSVRTTLGANEVVIVGLVMQGGSKSVLVRAVGPGLVPHGVTNAMADPKFTVFNGAGTSVATNDNWGGDATVAATFTAVGAFPLPSGSSLDAAFVRALDGNNTIQVSGPAAGNVLVEAYDTAAGNTTRLTNVSARNFVGTGDNVMIAGFAISGTGNKNVLIRAVGPGLSQYGVTNLLLDPKLQIFDGAGKLVAENDSYSASLVETFKSVAAFALTPGSKDAALIVNLPAGSYTAQVTGADGGTGNAIVELYELP